MIQAAPAVARASHHMSNSPWPAMAVSCDTDILLRSSFVFPLKGHEMVVDYIDDAVSGGVTCPQKSAFSSPFFFFVGFNKQQGLSQSAASRYVYKCQDSRRRHTRRERPAFFWLSHRHKLRITP